MFDPWVAIQVFRIAISISERSFNWQSQNRLEIDSLKVLLLFVVVVVVVELLKLQSEEVKSERSLLSFFFLTLSHSRFCLHLMMFDKTGPAASRLTSNYHLALALSILEAKKNISTAKNAAHCNWRYGNDLKSLKCPLNFKKACYNSLQLVSRPGSVKSWIGRHVHT